MACYRCLGSTFFFPFLGLVLCVRWMPYIGKRVEQECIGLNLRVNTIDNTNF